MTEDEMKKLLGTLERESPEAGKMLKIMMSIAAVGMRECVDALTEPGTSVEVNGVEMFHSKTKGNSP